MRRTATSSADLSNAELWNQTCEWWFFIQNFYSVFEYLDYSFHKMGHNESYFLIYNSSENSTVRCNVSIWKQRKMSSQRWFYFVNMTLYLKIYVFGATSLHRHWY